MNAAPQKSTTATPASAHASNKPFIPEKGKGEFISPAQKQDARKYSIEFKNGQLVYTNSQNEALVIPSEVGLIEAIKIIIEAIAAENRLGQTPPPGPVGKPKGAAAEDQKKGKKGEEGKKGKKEKKAAKLSLKKGKKGKGKKKKKESPVAEYLKAKGEPILERGEARLAELKTNEQTHDNAADKQKQAEKSVVIPPEEGQSKSNTTQVGTVSAKPAPEVDEKKGKDKLQESLKDHTPKTIEEVSNFKRDQKARRISSDVLGVVQADKNNVTATFSDMKTTPPPAPPEHEPEELPPEEIAPMTPVLGLGEGAIAPLLPEHTDVSKYTNDASKKLDDEGITQEQLDMVDSGDLAEANKEKKKMEKIEKTEPAKAKQVATQAKGAVELELQQEEKKGRKELTEKRKNDLSETRQKQGATKTALEKKREKVAKDINDIYEKAQTSVKTKLENLETQSMKRFDEGNAKASKKFEVDVKSDIKAFERRRYSGFWGWAKRAKDWLLGMDDLPEVKQIFDTNRSTFVTTIDKLVADISAENKKVIEGCKQELADAKKKIKKYVDSLGPDLKDIGKKASEEMNRKLGALDQFIAKKETELKNKLQDKQKAAIKEIDKKIEKMKEAMSGALAKLGKLLLYAAKKFFTWALEKFGFSLAEIEDIINKGAAVLKAIFTQPIQFVKNLVKAASTGFENFGKNFLKHLKNALFEWLTGSLEGITLPTTWDFKGIISVALQMIGISYANIRKHMVDAAGEPVVVALEEGFTLVKTLVTEGPIAAWEKLKELAGELKKAFVDAVKDFIKWKIIEEAIKWVVSLFIPGAGIIKAIIGIYDTIVFFIQKAKQIAQMIGNFLGSIGQIAMGNVAAGADALEQGLARGLTLVISFLAQLLRMTGITNKIKEAIAKVRGKVDKVLAKAAKWVVGKAKNFLGKAGSKALGGDPNAPGPQRVQAALAEAVPKVNRHAGKKVGHLVLKPLLAPVKTKHRLSLLQVVPKGNIWVVKAAASPAEERDTNAQVGEGDADADIDIAKLPTPVYDFKPSGGKAKRASVKNLSANRNMGSGPGSAKPVGWTYLQSTNQTLTQGGLNFVRMHLINENFGGLGRVNNLAPGPDKRNKEHLRKVEKEIKKKVGSAPKTPGKGAVVNYSVKVEYRSGGTVLQASPNVKMSDFPEKFVCNWEWKPSPTTGKFTKVDEVTVPIDAPAIGAPVNKRLTRLSINDSVQNGSKDEHKEALSTLKEIGTSRLGTLISEGPYPTWSAIPERVAGVTDETTQKWRTSGNKKGVKVTLSGTTTWT